MFEKHMNKEMSKARIIKDIYIYICAQLHKQSGNTN